ncbi:hypothetical protein ACFL5O_04635, partial [Myxococcota bacterium]
YGVALRSGGLEWIRARADWRRVINRDAVVITSSAEPAQIGEVTRGARVSSERAGASLELLGDGLGSVSGRAAYDLLGQTWTEAQAAVEWYATKRWVLGAEGEYYLPTFDGDSIFNWFTHHGVTRMSLRSSWRISRRWELASSMGTRTFRTDAKSYANSTTLRSAGPVGQADSGRRATVDVLGSFSGVYLSDRTTLTVNSTGQAGAGAHLVGADITARRWLGDGYYDTLVALSFYDWSDDLRHDRDASSFTYVLGGGIHPGDRSRVGIELEYTVNRLVGCRFRAVGTVDLSVLR